jgi:hypothetical protein
VLARAAHRYVSDGHGEENGTVDAFAGGVRHVTAIRMPWEYSIGQ